MRHHRVPAAVFAVALSALVGGYYGPSALATQDALNEQLRVFSAALDAIESQYVEPVESERLVYSAINGLLQTLDPHSSFLDPRSYAQMRERQEGRYFGLGITIQVIDGDITVVSLFEDTPAYRRGIRRGDVIARVEGEDAKGWTVEQAIRRLRGPRGTEVAISIKRWGFDELLDLRVERDEIHIPTIRGAFLVDDRTGYVRLRDFSETTDHDLSLALKALAAKGMKRLVLDLRDNPGGPLDQAIRVSNRFLPRGNLIVYTRGRVRKSDQDYRASEETEFGDLPIIALVNRNSASASEIVAGALQDHDRGLVVGETTFGKALVQSIYPISEGAGLALTTARYYTPSGRLIQRPWDGTFDEYLTYTWRDQDPARASRNAADLRYTSAGRKVFGGGGIEPDHHKSGSIEGFEPTKFGRLLYARQVFGRYAERFTSAGDTRVGAQSRDRKVVSKGFDVDAAMVADFKAFVRQQQIPFDEAAFAADLVFIRAMIRHAIDLALFRVDEAQRRLLADDPQAQYALTLFPEAVKLTQLAKVKTSPVGGR